MNSRFLIGIIFIALGISAFSGIDLGRFIAPLILIWIGWLFLTGNRRPFRRNYFQQSEQDLLNEVYIFSGTRKNLTSGNFIGGKIVVIFGGAEFDLSSVKTKQKKINMELVSVFGGLKIRLPDDWTVTSEAVAIIGGVDNKTSSKPKAIELHINGAAIFGGIEIGN